MRELVLFLCLASCVPTSTPIAQQGAADGTKTFVVRSEPPHEAVVAKAPHRVILLFSEPVRLVEFFITGTDGLSSPAMVTSAGLQNRYLIPVTTSATETYTVSWRALKVDNEVMQGTVRFTVR